MRLRAKVVREYIRGKFVFQDRWIWKNYDVKTFPLLPHVFDLRLLFRELFIAGARLRSPGEAGFSPLIGPWRK